MSTQMVTSGDAGLLIGAGPDGPELVFIGAARAAGAIEFELGIPQAGKDAPPRAPVLPTGAEGSAPATVELRGPDGRVRALRWEQVSCSNGSSGTRFHCIAEGCVARIEIVAATANAFDLRASVSATGSDRIFGLAVNVTVGHRFGRLVSFGGRWCAEFERSETELETAGATRILNRAGRTSHRRAPQILLEAPAVGAEAGEVVALALHEPGDFLIEAERLTEGPVRITAGKRVDGGRDASVCATVAWTDRGRQGAARALHRYLNARVWQGPVPTRRIHYNTWEGVYFEHDRAVLSELIVRAARLGVERWILDDGWFLGRDDDSTSLGDWMADPKKYPRGLRPIVEEVKSAGMDFGLWVEPEMVSPGSSLFAAHPDWVLGHAGAPLVEARRQLVLNLAMPEVRDFIVSTVCGLLESHDIACLKWDMNRDTWQKHAATGKLVSSEYSSGLMSVLQRIRARHPRVEIESCASGGGRANFAILGPTKRIWASDSNDPLERQRIHAGFRQMFPASTMGAHAGARRCHTTGRVHDMEFRAQTAFLGHMGCELDLRELTGQEEAALSYWFARYKELRALIHRGEPCMFDRADPNERAFGVTDGARSIVQVAQLDRPRFGLPEPLRLTFASPDASYRVTWLRSPGSRRRPAAFKRLAPIWEEADAAGVTGAQLLAGLPLPGLAPASAVTLLIEEV